MKNARTVLSILLFVIALVCVFVVLNRTTEHTSTASVSTLTSDPSSAIGHSYDSKIDIKEPSLDPDSKAAKKKGIRYS